MTVPGAPSHDETVRRLRDLIRVEITDATSQASVRMPVASEADLMRRYLASRDTVRDALALLTDEGIIERRRGVGTHPRSTRRPYPVFLPPETERLESYLGIGTIVPRLLHWAWVPAPPPVVRRLDGVNPRDHCLCIDYVLVHEGTPTGAVTNYLRAEEAAHIRPDAFNSDFYTLVDSGDPVIGSHDLTLQATVADEYVAELIDVRRGDPVMWFEQIIRNTRGEAIDFAVAHFRSEVRMDITGIPRVDIAGLRVGPSAG